MHEHGVADRVMHLALTRAFEQGGELCAIRVRLGALYPGDEATFRALLEHVQDHLGRRDVRADIVVDETHPAGVELMSIELREALA